MDELPDSQTSRHVFRLMEEAYTKIQKSYNMMGTGFGKLTLSELGEVWQMLHDSEYLISYAHNSARRGVEDMMNHNDPASNGLNEEETEE